MALERLRLLPGLRLHELRPAERAAFRYMAQPVYGSFEQRIGAELLCGPFPAPARVPT